MKATTDVQKRSSWIIIDIIERNGLSNTKLGEIMGCGKNTINNYRHAITTPGAEFIANLSNYYDVSVEWLHTGIGEPYKGDWMEADGKADGEADGMGEKEAAYPLSGSDETAPLEAESVADSPPPEGAFNPRMNPEISPILEKAELILESDTFFSNALFENIDALYQSVMDEENRMEFQNEMERLKSEVNSLGSRIEKLKDKSRKSRAPEKKRAAKKPRKAATAGKPKTRRVKKTKMAEKPKARKTKKTQAAKKPKTRKAKTAVKTKGRKTKTAKKAKG